MRMCWVWYVIIFYYYIYSHIKVVVSSCPLMAQLVDSLPAMWEIWVQSPGEDPLEKGKATHSSILT